MPKSIWFSLFFICGVLKLQAQIELVKDINDTFSYQSNYTDKIVYNGNIYLAGKLDPTLDSVNHIFKYDINTQQFSICLDVTSTDGPFFAFVYNNYLYYYTTDALQNWSLWKTDGTTAFNQLIHSNMKNTSSTGAGAPVEYNGNLYFIGNDAANGYELWVTDGTTSGTHIVKDIRAGSNSSGPKFLTVYNNKIYFNADDGLTGEELWMSDGTNNGTVLVKDIYSGVYSSSPYYMKVINGKIVFTAITFLNGRELWVTDGTSAGTALLKDINLGMNGSNILGFYSWNNKLCFDADSNNIRKIFETDGTPSGTNALFNPTPGNSIIGILQPFNSQILFVGNTTSTGNELWRTDGTLVGTYMVKDIAQSFYSSNPSNVVLDTLNNGLIITADNDTSATTSNTELWFTDGTTTGTYLIKDINNKPTSTIMYGSRLLLNNKIYFEADNDTLGTELYVTDGTNAGTKLVVDAESCTLGAGTFLSINGGPLFNFQNNNFFRATTKALGTELWITDGTNGGTRLVEDILPGTTSPNLRYLDTLNGELYLFLKTSQDELRKVNSNFTGTSIIKSITPTMLFYRPIKYNNKIYFNGVQEPQISLNMPSNTWVTDGTTAGTIALLPFVMKYGIVYNNKILFYGMDSTQDSELWISDGTLGGTQLVKNINTSSNSDIKFFTPYNGFMYFIATDATNGDGLWKTDGTAAGTVLVKDLNSQIATAGVIGMQVCGNKIYIMLNNVPAGTTKLWVSDGTTSGTNFIPSSIPGFDFTGVALGNSFFYEYNGKAYFWLYNWQSPSSNDGFWTSDGTSAGTYLLKYGLPMYGEAVTSNGLMYFGMGDSITGIELYRSDGTPNGTSMVQDKFPGKLGLSPVNLTNSNGTILFFGQTRETGTELFSYCAETQGTASVSGSSTHRLKACEGVYNLSPCEKICEVTNNYLFDADVIKAQVWIDNLLGSSYVSRRYELKNKPTEYNNSGSITLYFKQSEFDLYNSQSNYYVPIDSFDSQNYKSNIVVAHYADTSVGETGLISSYNASTLTTIDPLDSNIKWNSNLHCWEIKFDYAQGYGGFFIKGLNPLSYATATLLSPKVYPNPINETCLVDIGNSKTIHEAVLFNLLGTSIKHFSIHSHLNQLDLSFLKPGVYILQVGDEFYTKLVKQ